MDPLRINPEEIKLKYRRKMESRPEQGSPKVVKADHKVGHYSGSTTMVRYDIRDGGHEEARLARSSSMVGLQGWPRGHEVSLVSEVASKGGWANTYSHGRDLLDICCGPSWL
nr:hypothetical protein Iba_chr01cCG2730 [Ipomoea batatas]